jgi:fumarate hydratase class II
MKAAEIAKQAYEQNRPVVEVAAELTDIPVSELRVLLDPAKLT